MMIIKWFTVKFNSYERTNKKKKRRIYLLYMAIISVIKTNINHKNKIKYNVPEKLNIS